jgi:hypothetical protein
MVIKLEPQLPILNEDGLRTLVSAQRARVAKIHSLIASANAKIDAAVKAAAPKVTGLSSEQERVFKQVERQNAATIRIAVRRETDQEILPILREVNAESANAKVRGERHHDLWSVLRRATNGLGIVAAAELRAAYCLILDQAGAVELARWAQQAVDTGDAILADAVIRANDSRKSDDRSFTSAALMTALPNEEHTRLQALLKNVIDLAAEAGLAWSEFERGKSDGLRRIALGLAKQKLVKLVKEEVA